MLKFRSIFTILFIYFLVIQSYLFFIDPSSITLDFFYRNILFWVIYLIIANLIMENDNLLNFKLYKYEDKKKFLKESIKEASIKNIIICVGISILNYLVVMTKTDVEVHTFIYYFVNLFLIIEIICICNLSFILRKNSNFIRYLLFIISLIVFYFGTFFKGIIPINIFKYAIYIGSLYEIIIHYLIWLTLDYILIDQNFSKRIEI